jgi:hypothetical protein
VEDLVVKGRRIYLTGSPDEGIALPVALKAYQYADLPMPIVGRGSWMDPAILNAIGVDFTELPVTPEKILKALEEKRGEKI